ncbi:MAG: hypothetical protein V1787_02835, partial [Candidatus Micrarchaeota archaeon]
MLSQHLLDVFVIEIKAGCLAQILQGLLFSPALAGYAQLRAKGNEGDVAFGDYGRERERLLHSKPTWISVWTGKYKSAVFEVKSAKIFGEGKKKRKRREKEK